MSKEICTIGIPKGWLDDDYTFYEDGTIKRVYDAHPMRSDITVQITADQISDLKKSKIIDSCLDEHKEKINEILFGK